MIQLPQLGRFMSEALRAVLPSGLELDDDAPLVSYTRDGNRIRLAVGFYLRVVDKPTPPDTEFLRRRHDSQPPINRMDAR